MKSTPEQMTNELKSLRIQKGIISGKFKTLLKDSSEHLQQLELMKQISLKIKLLEANIKDTATEGKNTDNASPLPRKTPFGHLGDLPDWNNEITITTEAFRSVSEWPRLIQNSKISLPSHDAAWIDVIEKSFGHNSLIICARSASGELIGGIPLVVFSSPLFGKFAVSIPFLNYGGMVSYYKDVSKKLMNSVESVRKELDLKHVEVRSIYEGLGDNFSTKKVSMILQLPTDDNQLEKTLGSKLRAQYKKAEEFNPSFKIGKQDLLEDFYSVFARNMRDLGTPVYSKSWFGNILKDPRLDSNIIVVYVKNKPVSCGFLVRHESLMEIPWASTIKSANKYNTNMWMYRKILSFSIEQECKYFDFGRSTVNAGTYKFKKQWGAEPHQNYWYHFLSQSDQKPEINPDNPKLRIFIALWKWLPVWIANIIGPQIIKGIP